MFGHYTTFGNVIDVRQAGKNKVIVLARARFGKKSTNSAMENIMVFERQFDALAELESALADRRQETGNEKSALQNVKLEVVASPQADGKLQAQFVKILDVKAPAKAKAVAQA